MKRALFGSVVVALLAGTSWAVAETAAKQTAPVAVDHGSAVCPGGMMGPGMMGPGMMGGGMGPMMMGGSATKVAVKNIDKGVTITFTSADSATVARLQKMAEAMRLMHEATSPAN